MPRQPTFVACRATPRYKTDFLGRGKRDDLRDLSCLLLCSDLLKARLQNWHWYFLTGGGAPVAADDALRLAVGETLPASGASAVMADDIDFSLCFCILS